MTTKDLAITTLEGINIGSYIGTDEEKAANQYLIFMLTRTGSDVFYETLSPIADIGSSNISVDLDTFKMAFMTGHLKAVEFVKNNYPNIDIDATDVIISEDLFEINLEVKNTETGVSTQIVI